MSINLPECKSVEEWLDSVSYGPDHLYVPSDFALHFIAFIKLVNGSEGEENKTPVLHLRMLDQLAGSEDRLINMLFRGAAKTTLLGEYLFLYIAVYGEIPGFGDISLGLYVSDSVENGVKNMRKNLEFRWENSEFLQQYLPVAKFTDIRWEFHNADGHRLVIKGYGAKTGVRGTKEMGKRPQLAVLDDLVSDEDARSETVIAAIEDTVSKAINYALHPKKSLVIWSGTPFNQRDPLYKAVESGAWSVNVYPVCEKFPCTPEEFRGAWEDRFPYEFVMRQYTKAKLEGKLSSFYQELMLRIVSQDERVLDDSDVRWYSRQLLLRNRNAFNFYITTDFATSERTAGDYSAISVWAMNSNSDWYWVDGVCKRQLMDANVDDLFRFVQQYRPVSVGIEVNGQQGGFIPWIQNEMMRRNVYFTFASFNNGRNPGIRSKGDKYSRFNDALPLFKAGKMYFPQELKDGHEMQEMMRELFLVTPGKIKSKQDDMLDTVTQLPLMNAVPPGVEIPMNQNGSGIWEPDMQEAETDFSSYFV